MWADLPVVAQYAIVFGVVFVVALVGLWIYNRREKRRKHAIELARLMDKWGLDWFAGGYRDYAVGDYSGLIWRVKQIVEAVRSDEAMVAQLIDCTKRVCAYLAEHDPKQATAVRKLLEKE